MSSLRLLSRIIPRPACASRWLAVAAVLAATSTGCEVCRHARRTLLEEPAEYSYKRDRPRSLRLYREWADQEWSQFAGNCGDGQDPDEFGAGFRDGFVDYVFAGGTGEPPPVPPRKFWNAAWRNPAGHAASADWFNGYRVGASVARDGGYRRAAIVRSAYEFAGPLPHDGLPIAGEPPYDAGEPGEMVVPPQPEPRQTPEATPLPAPNASPRLQPPAGDPLTENADPVPWVELAREFDRESGSVRPAQAFADPPAHSSAQESSGRGDGTAASGSIRLLR